MVQAIILMLCAAVAMTVDVLTVHDTENKINVMLALIVTAIVAADIGYTVG